MSKVIAGYGDECALLGAIHGSFSGFDVVRGASFDFDKTEHIFLPADQIDFSAMIGRAEIARDHYVSVTAQIKVSGFFAASADAEMIGGFFGRERVGGEPVEGTNRGVGEATGGHHEIRVKDSDEDLV